MTKAIPEGYNTLTACFTLKDCDKAIEFYKQALGAEVVTYMKNNHGPGVMHASLKIGNSMIMMADEMCNEENSPKSAETLGNSPMNLYVYVADVDAVFDRAISAGGSIVMPVTDMFWGDRCGNFKDPFGYTWMIATHTQDLTPEQMSKGAEQAYAQMAKE